MHSHGLFDVMRFWRHFLRLKCICWSLQRNPDKSPHVFLSRRTCWLNWFWTSKDVRLISSELFIHNLPSRFLPNRHDKLPPASPAARRIEYLISWSFQLQKWAANFSSCSLFAFLCMFGESCSWDYEKRRALSLSVLNTNSSVEVFFFLSRNRNCVAVDNALYSIVAPCSMPAVMLAIVCFFFTFLHFTEVKIP